MSKKMLINASHPEENRVAIVVDGVLSELDIELAGQEQSKGNIYKAVVVRVETGLQAAFVDYGAEKLGFLQIGEIHPKLHPKKDETKGRPRIADILQRGQEILVQIVKEERGNKGAALTTYLSLPGRYMVLMPDSDTKGVSRKIAEDSERKKLKRTMAELDLPEDMGYIVRTAGIGKDKDELKRDFDYLVRLYQGIVARQNEIKAPAQLYQESNLAIRSIRDYFSNDMDEVLIDGHQVYQDARDFFALVMPEQKHLVKRHRERRPIFSRYQIEEQIDGLSKNQTPMPSGGSIVIDQTEALVAIDVNSGKMASESGIEATALKTNLEAAVEVGRQLRLRDLGGLVVIDFIDMRDRKNIREVEQQLRKALKNDKAKVSVGRISQFGLLEMSRQRLKPTLSVGSYNECPHCQGAGRIRSIEAQAVSLLRQAHTAASKGQIGLIEARVPVAVANYLLNQKRETIIDLERQLNLRMIIEGRDDMLPGTSELLVSKKEKENKENNEVLPISHANQIEVALAAQQEEDQHRSETQDNINDHSEEVDQVEEKPAPEKKKRRRRRRKSNQDRQRAEEAGEQPSSDQEESADATAVVKPAEATDAEDQEKSNEAEKKPRRRSRRSKAQIDAAAEAQSTQSETAVEQSLEQPPEADEVNPKETSDPAAEENNEQRPRRRSRRPKTVQQPTPESGPKTEEPTAQKMPVTQEESDSTQQPTATENARPPRRGRRPKAQSTTSDGQVSTDASAAAQDTSEQAQQTVSAEVETDAEPPKKPRRGGRRKTAASSEETAGQTLDSGQNTEENPAAPTQGDAQEEKAPVKRAPRSRRKTTKTAETEAAAESATETTEQSSETVAVEKKRRPGRPRKTPVTEDQSTSKEAAEATDPEVKKPQRRTRKTAAKKTEQTEAAVDNTEEPAKKPQRRNRKSTEVVTSAADGASEEQKKAPARRRRTKAPTSAPEGEQPTPESKDQAE